VVPRAGLDTEVRGKIDDIITGFHIQVYCVGIAEE
jgi:hypothetical protein